MQRFKALFQVPSSVSLFICYVLYTMTENTGMIILWHSQSCRLLPYLSHHKFVYYMYDKSQSSHPWCCGSTGWLVLCAVTWSPCTSVELITLPLQLVITCSMRQYSNVILKSAVSFLASFQRAQRPLEPSCALRYTGYPFICTTKTIGVSDNWCDTIFNSVYVYCYG